MRILCCVDGNNVEPISKAISTLLGAETKTIKVLYVTDTEPIETIKLHRERLLRSPLPVLPRYEQMRQAEDALAKEILEEGSRALGGVEMVRRIGRPEQEIVSVAREWQADLIVMSSGRPHGHALPDKPKPPKHGPKPPGHEPKPIGHVARFVLDHAPCPALLIPTRPDPT